MIYTINPSQWYLTFISIVFGVFFAVWIVPISKYYPDVTDTPDTPNDELKKTLTTLRSLSMVRGAVMFVMLVCLWWWYGTFIGHIAPALGFWDYLFDFVTLCSFAVAFQMWSHRTLFPMVVFFAAGLMFIRFSMAYQDVEAGSAAQSAMWGAIVALALFMLAAVSALIGAGAVMVKGDNHTSYIESLEALWTYVEYAILALLVIGIFVTFYAVWLTEGLPFSIPISPDVWMKPKLV